MSLHQKPKTATEKLALHLETNYGLQLDPGRHKALVEELEVFQPVPAAPSPITVEAIRGAVARGWCHRKNEAKVFDGDLAIAISYEVVCAVADAGLAISYADGEPDLGGTFVHQVVTETLAEMKAEKDSTDAEGQ
jgi:hypothetical protein